MTKVISSFVCFENTLSKDEYLYSTAKLRVDGFGEVEIKDWISKELAEQMEKEIQIALRVKLGQVVSCAKEPKEGNDEKSTSGNGDRKSLFGEQKEENE